MIDFLLSLIYPNVCGFCGRIDENSLCKDCEEKIKKVLKCKIEDIKNKYFDKHIYLALYKGEFREHILSYKFFDKSYMYKTFAKLLLKNKKICEIIRKL